MFVLSETKAQRNGFFVEFGAADGINLSNTYLLEKHFGWSGILAEPAKVWHQALAENRTCIIDHDCVFDVTGSEIEFREATDPLLSTLAPFVGGDLHGSLRANGKAYRVSTVTLNDLLQRHQAPTRIDYLSVDTEGSELAILQAFDFDRYDVRIITCEHNFTPARDEIFSLLTAKGFTRVKEDLSAYDDWYVKKN